MDRWIDGRIDRWMDGWMDRYVLIYIYIHTYIYMLYIDICSHLRPWHVKHIGKYAGNRRKWKPLETHRQCTKELPTAAPCASDKRKLLMSAMVLNLFRTSTVPKR